MSEKKCTKWHDAAAKLSFYYFLPILLTVAVLVGFVVIQKQCYHGNVTSHFSSLFTLSTRGESFPAVVSGTVTEDAQVSYWPFVFILFACLFFLFPSNTPRSL